MTKTLVVALGLATVVAASVFPAGPEDPQAAKVGDSRAGDSKAATLDLARAATGVERVRLEDNGIAARTKRSVSYEASPIAPVTSKAYETFTANSQQE